MNSDNQVFAEAFPLLWPKDVAALSDWLVAYSFTVTDRDGNQWWVNAESGFLDQLREPS